MFSGLSWTDGPHESADKHEQEQQHTFRHILHQITIELRAAACSMGTASTYWNFKRLIILKLTKNENYWFGRDLEEIW